MTTHEEAKKTVNDQVTDSKKLGQEKVASLTSETDSVELSEEELASVAGAGLARTDDSN